MKSSYRTALAFIVAPLVALSEFAIVSASTRPASEGLSWISSFLSWFVLSAIQIYTIVLFFGAIVFAILSSLKKESRLAYTNAGILAGIGFAGLLSAIASSHSAGKGVLFLTVFAAIGGSTGATFSVIRIKRNA